MKEIEVSIVLSVPDTDTEDIVSDRLIELAEANGWTFGGCIKAWK